MCSPLCSHVAGFIVWGEYVLSVVEGNALKSKHKADKAAKKRSTNKR